MAVLFYSNCCMVRARHWSRNGAHQLHMLWEHVLLSVGQYTERATGLRLPPGRQTAAISFAAIPKWNAIPISFTMKCASILWSKIIKTARALLNYYNSVLCQ